MSASGSAALPRKLVMRPRLETRVVAGYLLGAGRRGHKLVDEIPCEVTLFVKRQSVELCERATERGAHLRVTGIEDATDD